MNQMWMPGSTYGSDYASEQQFPQKSMKNSKASYLKRRAAS